MTRRFDRWRGSLALAGLLLCTLDVQAIEVGHPAPSFTATLLDGTRFDLAAHRGEVVVINFWATWCAPCREEMPAFEALQRTYRDQGLVIVAVSMDDPELRERVLKLAQDFSYPMAMAGDTKAAGYGRIWRLPISFVIDRQGLLRVDGGIGERKAYDLHALLNAVGPLLREPRPDASR